MQQLLRMIDTDQDKLNSKLLVPCGPSSAVPPPTALALQKDALSTFLEQMSLSQKTLPPMTQAFRNRNNIKCKPAELTRRSDREPMPNLLVKRGKTYSDLKLWSPHKQPIPALPLLPWKIPLPCCSTKDGKIQP